MKTALKLVLTVMLLWSTGCSGSSSDNTSPPSIAAASSSSLSASALSSASLSASSSSSAAPSTSLYPNYNTNRIAADPIGASSTAMQIAGKIRLGLNIGNTMEATGGETAWGNPKITSALIQAAKQLGFNAIRIPVSWDQYANQQTAQIDAAWLQRVKDVVQYCVDNDMYVIVNIHWDGGWLENHVTLASKDAVNAKQKAYWQQIATTLRNFDEHVMFASANEPNADTAEQMTVLLSYHQTFIDAVRSTGGKNAYRVLVVQGPNTDVDKTNRLMTQLPVDTVPNKLMAEIHYYTPWNFTGMTKDETSGNQFFYWGKHLHSMTDTAHNPTWGEEDTVDAKMALLKAQFLNKNIPVVVGEFGATDRRNVPANVAIMSADDANLHETARAYYYKYVAKQKLAVGVLPFVWDTGGLISRSNYTVLDQQDMDGLMQGANGL